MLAPRHRLPLGYGGTIELPGPTGDPVRVACLLLRCAPAAGGWYDGCAAFNRLQPQFESSRCEAETKSVLDQFQ